jgi:hypothetical protein
VYILRSALIQQSQKEIRLHQRFASGERDTTARLVVENDILFDFGHDFANDHFDSDDLPGASRTDIRTSSTEYTFLRICYGMVLNERNRFVWTFFYALTASETPAFAKAKFDISPPAFRIMTPQTIQWTAFEKHCSTDSRAVMYGVLLDIEYKSLRL